MGYHGTGLLASMNFLQTLSRICLIGIAIQSSALAQVTPQGTIGGLTQHCKDKWGGDIGMIDYCMKNQILDYKRVQQSPVNSQAKQGCQERWGNDFGMVQACIRNSAGRPAPSPSASNVQYFDNPGDTEAPKASVNGRQINKCSHGEVCYGQMLEAMRLSN